MNDERRRILEHELSKIDFSLKVCESSIQSNQDTLARLHILKESLEASLMDLTPVTNGQTVIIPSV
jgi:hypothetical protein